MLRKIARLLALLLMASGACFSGGAFLINYSLFRTVPTHLYDKTIRYPAGEFAAPGFLSLYGGSLMWAIAFVLGLLGFLCLPLKRRGTSTSPTRKAMGQPPVPSEPDEPRPFADDQQD